MTRTRRVAFTALFTAVSVVLTRFVSIRIAVAGVEGIRIGIGSLPIIMAGTFLGPVYGAIRSWADVVGIFEARWALNAPFTLTQRSCPTSRSVLHASGGAGSRAALRTVTDRPAVSAGRHGVSSLTPYFLTIIYDYPWAVIMPPRIVLGMIEIPAYSVIVNAVSATYMRLAASRGPV